jgi:hypothetical protein
MTILSPEAPPLMPASWHRYYIHPGTNETASVEVTARDDVPNGYRLKLRHQGKVASVYEFRASHDNQQAAHLTAEATAKGIYVGAQLALEAVGFYLSPLGSKLAAAAAAGPPEE